MVHFQNEVRHQVDIWLNDDTNSSENALAIPNKQEFAINNIQMNMTKKMLKINQVIKSVTSNEYGTNWYTYYDKDYNNFIMISYIKIELMRCIQIRT